MLPGYNVPIVMSTVLDTIDSDSVCVSNEAPPGAYLFEGQYKARVYDDPDTLAIQANVWNASNPTSVRRPLLTKASSKPRSNNPG